jgi:hypothetical protein
VRSGRSYALRATTPIELETPATNGAGTSERARPTPAEVLAPVHEDFRQSGMTEHDLDASVEEVREEIWREKRGRESTVL